MKIKDAVTNVPEPPGWLSEDAFGEDNGLKRAIQRLAREILHLRAGLAAHHLPDFHRGRWNGDPGLFPVILKKNICISAGVHRLHYFSRKGIISLSRLYSRIRLRRRSRRIFLI